MKAASKLTALTSLGLAMLLGGGCANLKENTKMDTIYQFTAKGRNGASLDLASLKGKVLLIVNTATGCGFTPSTRGLKNSTPSTTAGDLRYSTSRATSLGTRRRGAMMKSTSSARSSTIHRSISLRRSR